MERTILSTARYLLYETVTGAKMLWLGLNRKTILMAPLKSDSNKLFRGSVLVGTFSLIDTTFGQEMSSCRSCLSKFESL